MSKPRKPLLIGVLVFLLCPLLVFAAWFAIIYFNPFHCHEHCIKNSGLTLRIYATDHNGRFPYATNGFPAAILALLQADVLGETNASYAVETVRYFTAPGDNGEAFKQALKTGHPPSETQCSRIYIQGLTEANNPNIAILFDKRSTPGGDHFRRPWGPRLREVCMLDGSMKTIGDADWPNFATNQIKLLIEEGIPRETARHYYQIP